MMTINKGTKVDTSNLQLGELVHMDFVFYNITTSVVLPPSYVAILDRNIR